jgi:hypothetical protein
MVRKKRSIFRAGYTAKYFDPLPLHVSSSVSSSRGERSVGRMVLTLPRRPFTHPRTCQQVRRNCCVQVGADSERRAFAPRRGATWHPAGCPSRSVHVVRSISRWHASHRSTSCNASMDVERSITACHAIHQSMSRDPSVHVTRSISRCRTIHRCMSRDPSVHVSSDPSVDVERSITACHAIHRSMS